MRCSVVAVALVERGRNQCIDIDSTEEAGARAGADLDVYGTEDAGVGDAIDVMTVPKIRLAKAAGQVCRRVTANLPRAVASLRRVVGKARLWPRIIAGYSDDAVAEAILGACSHA